MKVDVAILVAILSNVLSSTISANLVKDQIDEELKQGQGPHAQTQVVALLIKVRFV